MLNPYTRRKLMEADPELIIIDGEVTAQHIERANQACRVDGLDDMCYCVVAEALKDLGWQDVRVAVWDVWIGKTRFHLDLESQALVWSWARHGVAIPPFAFTIVEERN